MQPAAPVPANATSSASLRADDEDVRSIAYKGVVRLMKGYTPPPNWRDALSSNSALLGLTRLDDILEDCQRWQRSRRGGNPHNLTDDEILACGLFTYDLGMNGKREENFFYIFNKMLRERNPQTMQHWMPYVYYFMSALNKLPTEAGMVYRGTNLLSEVKSLYVEQSPVHWSAFTSVSKSPLVAEAFAGPNGVVIHIKVKTARSLSVYSVLPNEQELLLHPNSEFLVEREAHMENGVNVLKLIEIVHAQKVIDMSPLPASGVALAPKPAELNTNIKESYQMARNFLFGKGVPKDENEAAKLFIRAAEMGHAAAQYSLGWCYAHGKGVAKSESDALVWYQKAAAQGDADALQAMGSCYENARGVTKNDKEAVSYYRKAAEKDHVVAICKLGACYQKGQGVARDVREAIKWFRKAAELKNSNGEFKLGVAYETGQGVAKDAKEAVKWYQRAAEQGHAQAQVNLGLLHDTGKGVSKNQKEAVRYFRMAADSGHAIAQFNLGVCYAQGDGVAKDPVQAVHWYHKAAEQGHHQAQHALGLCYAGGVGVVKDEIKAAQWYTKAAEAGFAAAQYNLGVCYSNGTGVPRSDAEAQKWYRRAAEQGHSKAKSAVQD